MRLHRVVSEVEIILPRGSTSAEFSSTLTTLATTGNQVMQVVSEIICTLVVSWLL